VISINESGTKSKTDNIETIKDTDDNTNIIRTNSELPQQYKELDQSSPTKSKQASTINEPFKSQENIHDKVEPIKGIIQEAAEKSTKEQSSWN